MMSSGLQKRKPRQRFSKNPPFCYNCVTAIDSIPEYRAHLILILTCVETEKSGLFRGKMVPRGGFEPPTRGFSVHCSTN